MTDNLTWDQQQEGISLAARRESRTEPALPVTCTDCGTELPDGEGWDVMQAWDGTELHYCTTHFRAYRRRLYGEEAADLMERAMGGYDR